MFCEIMNHVYYDYSIFPGFNNVLTLMSPPVKYEGGPRGRQGAVEADEGRVEASWPRLLRQAGGTADG